MPDPSRISSSQAPHCVSFNFADQPFNVHSKDKVCGASPLCFFLPSSLPLYLTHVITLCPESLHLSIPDVALISPPDRKQNLGAQLETVRHNIKSGMFNHVQAYAVDTHMQGKESEKRHVGVGIVFTRVCSSLRLKAALHPQKADLERYPSPAYGRGRRELRAFHMVTHAPTQPLLISVLFGVGPTVSAIQDTTEITWYILPGQVGEHVLRAVNLPAHFPGTTSHSHSHSHLHSRSTSATLLAIGGGAATGDTPTTAAAADLDALALANGTVREDRQQILRSLLGQLDGAPSGSYCAEHRWLPTKVESTDGDGIPLPRQ
ncbi:hypothetical protein B0H19DRAFT_1079048 [Mycena capillaripes]|nr:hypothetical protein B0H19DRAFT_1079048 [Mycena capillaripes]